MIKVGDRLPEAKFRVMSSEGPPESDDLERGHVQDSSWPSIDDQHLAAFLDHFGAVDGSGEVVLGSTTDLHDDLTSGVRCDLAGDGTCLADQ